MAIPPFAVKRLIPAGSNDPEIIVVGVILHVDAGNADSLHDYFDGPSGGIESHGHIKRTGVLEWYRDTGREADANNKANSFIGRDGRRYGFISIETQGFGAGEWTAEQIATIKRVLLWARDVHDVPLVVCSGPFVPGVGFHTLFGAPSEWTPVSKSCPGPDRIKQFYSVIVPWMKATNIAASRPVSPTTAEYVAKAKPDLRDALKNLNKGAKKGNRPKVRAAAKRVKAALKLLRARNKN